MGHEYKKKAVYNFIKKLLLNRSQIYVKPGYWQALETWSNVTIAAYILFIE